MRLVEDLSPAHYNNEMAIPVSMGTPPIIIGDDVFTVPGWTMSTVYLEKYSHINNQLIKQGEFELPSESGANYVMVKGNIAYISMCMLGKIQIIDHTTMEDLGVIDLSEYGVGDNNPDPAISIIRDDILYVALNQLVGGYAPDMTRAKADVALIDTKTNKVIKVITSEAGFSMPTKPEADANSIFMDENKDIYINCISGFGFLGHKAGFLRIKNGETEFDNDYAFDVTQTNIEGEDQNADYLITIQYAGNGKLYATANINAYFSKEPNYFTDRSVVPLELDLNNKTIKRLTNLPASSNFGWSVRLVDNKILFGLATEKDKGFYTYDPVTGEASHEAVVKVNGYPGVILQIK